MWSLWITLTLFVSLSECQNTMPADFTSEIFDVENTLECRRKLYAYQVTKSDENGKQCTDTIKVWACWGRCDSNEVGIFSAKMFKIPPVEMS